MFGDILFITLLCIVAIFSIAWFVINLKSFLKAPKGSRSTKALLLIVSSVLLVFALIPVLFLIAIFTLPISFM